MSASQQDKEGHTPLFLALCEGHKGCADRLLHAGSSLQAVTKVGVRREEGRVDGGGEGNEGGGRGEGVRGEEEERE